MHIHVTVAGGAYVAEVNAAKGSRLVELGTTVGAAAPTVALTKFSLFSDKQRTACSNLDRCNGPQHMRGSEELYMHTH